MCSSNSYVDLLIVGAGPAGLTAACWAAQYNMSTRILDQKDGRTKKGHADGLQARTLEILEGFGIADSIVKQGVRNPDSCHWTTNTRTGNIKRVKKYETCTKEGPGFSQILINQGAVEQVFIDYLENKGKIHVEWNTMAESLRFLSDAGEDYQRFPVIVGVRSLEGLGLGEKEIINARYLVACDGAQSWARNELGVVADTVSEDSTWGVLDIVPITDFPDVRRSCSIKCQPHGSIMTVPRENRLVRFYIHLRELEETSAQYPDHSPEAILEIAKNMMKPYNLTYRYCDWWSMYKIGRRLAGQYRPQERVFLAGDAAHTHSPMGGQGMNVSIQDTYNLLWKLGEVIIGRLDPSILETYNSERRPVAKQLMTLDTCLVEAYEKKEDRPDEIYKIRDQYAGFMAGTDITYSSSILIADNGIAGALKIAKNLKLGMRLPSFPLYYQCDGVLVHMMQILKSDGVWRLLVFPGGLHQTGRMKALYQFSESFSNQPHLADFQQKRSSCDPPIMELLLIQPSSRTAAELPDLPELFRPFDDTLGWDYWRTFTDNQNQVYTGYGIDKRGPGCLILCRPDQHVAWLGSLADTAGLDTFFSNILGH